MITTARLEEILPYLEEEDRIPDEKGEYTVSHTIYGSSSLSRGGSYFDKANNVLIAEAIKDIEGIRERSSWPGVHSITFNPDEMDDRAAERLLLLLEDMNEHSGYPCLDEQLAYDMEGEDEMAAMRCIMDDLAFEGMLDVPGGMDPCGDEAVSLMLEIVRERDPAAIVCETGPDVYIDAESVVRCVDAFNGRIHRMGGRHES